MVGEGHSEMLLQLACYCSAVWIMTEMRKAVPFQDVGQTLHSKVHKLFTLYSVFMALTVQLSPAHSN